MLVFGLIIGSFLNVCISRIPEGISVFSPPSQCPKCKAKLKAYDLVPILSYILLFGRCRYCGGKIPFRYPAVEALTAVLFFFTYLKFGIYHGFFLTILFASLLIVIAFIDLEHMVIPDFLVVAGIAAGLARSFLNADLVNGLQGICFGFLFMFLTGSAARYILKKEALGDGDVKLAVMLGAFLGMEKTLISISLASIIGAMLGILLLLNGRIKRDEYIPFAPFLALGAIISIFI